MKTNSNIQETQKNEANLSYIRKAEPLNHKKSFNKLRCRICGQFLLINIDQKNLAMTTKCENNHINNSTLKNFLYFPVDNENYKCSKCQKNLKLNDLYDCSQCKKYFCKNCREHFCPGKNSDKTDSMLNEFQSKAKDESIIDIKKNIEKEKEKISTEKNNAQKIISNIMKKSKEIIKYKSNILLLKKYLLNCYKNNKNNFYCCNNLNIINKEYQEFDKNYFTNSNIKTMIIEQFNEIIKTNINNKNQINNNVIDKNKIYNDTNTNNKILENKLDSNNNINNNENKDQKNYIQDEVIDANIFIRESYKAVGQYCDKNKIHETKMNKNYNTNNKIKLKNTESIIDNAKQTIIKKSQNKTININININNISPNKEINFNLQNKITNKNNNFINTDYINSSEISFVPTLKIIEKDKNQDIYVIKPEIPDKINNILCIDKRKIIISFDKKSPNAFLYEYQLLKSKFIKLYSINIHETPINYMHLCIYTTDNQPKKFLSLSDNKLSLCLLENKNYEELFKYHFNENAKINLCISSRNRNFMTKGINNDLLYWVKKENTYIPIEFNYFKNNDNIIISMGEIYENTFVVSHYKNSENNEIYPSLTFFSYDIKRRFYNCNTMEFKTPDMKLSTNANSIKTIFGYFFVLLNDGSFLLFKSIKPTSHFLIKKITILNSSKILLFEIKMFSIVKIIFATVEEENNQKFIRKYIINGNWLEQKDENIIGDEKNAKVEKEKEIKLQDDIIIDNIWILSVNDGQINSEYIFPFTNNKQLLLIKYDVKAPKIRIGKYLYE